MQSELQQYRSDSSDEQFNKNLSEQVQELYRACEENNFERVEYILIHSKLDAKFVRQAFLHCCFHGHIGLIQLFSKVNKLNRSYMFDFSHGFRLAWENEHFAAARRIFNLQPSLTLNLR